MINRELVNPRSIVVVGASNNISKTGGKVLKNIIDRNYKGNLYVVNPGSAEVLGIKSFPDVKSIPETELAIIAIAAKYCPETIETLANEKGVKAFIVISAGFGEESREGAMLEKQIVEIVNSVNGCLIGPNCIGVLNSNYAGVFTTPLPRLSGSGCELISGSGATVVFIMESGMTKGLTFSEVFSVGNSAQTGVEDVLQFLDETFDPATSSKVKLLYMENIRKPDLLLKHAASLRRKGCHIAAVKSGSTETGSRAATSHTGAIANSDIAVDALFRKAGIIRCNSRIELTSVASVLMHPKPKGKRIAIITHAGGPAVMLTDTLTAGGIEVPLLEGDKTKELLSKLNHGSSVANPIDFLATGTAEQLGEVIDSCENDFDNIDSMIVIFGSPGLTTVFDVYRLLDEKMKTCRKPIYPVIPSVINVKEEMQEFISSGRICFFDEVLLGNALLKVFNAPEPFDENIILPDINPALIRKIIDSEKPGYISQDAANSLLEAAGIPVAKTIVSDNPESTVKAAGSLGYPVVMKSSGPLHKSDEGGVILNINNSKEVEECFKKLMKVKDTTAVIIQPMLTGMELFAGIKKESNFGHLILCGLGGIFIEVLKDFSSGLAPLSAEECMDMIRKLKGYKIIKGFRGKPGADENAFADILFRISALASVAPEIAEMDINPLLAGENSVCAVDVRVRIEK